METQLEIFSAIFELITALAAVTVAATALHYAKRQTTLEALRDLQHGIADLEDRYSAIAELPNPMSAADVETIAKDPKRSTIVILQLNVLETFALAVKARVVDSSIAKRLAVSFLVGKFDQLRPFVTHMRDSRHESAAWVNSEKLADRWRVRTET